MRMRVEKAILLVSDGKCFYCKEKATQADHITPVRKGGTDDPENFVPACQPCNAAKHARLLPDHVEAFARAHARSLAKRLTERGISTYGARAGYTSVRLALSAEELAILDNCRRVEADLIGRHEMILRLIRRADAVAARRESRESAK